MPGMPVANAEHNGTEAYPIIAASGVRRLCAPGAAPPSDASAGMLLRDAPAALVGRQASNEESICRRGVWHQRGAAAGIQSLQGGEVGHRQELQVVGELFDGPCAAALHPPFVGGPVDVRHEDRRIEPVSKPSGRSSPLSSSLTTWSGGGGICSAVVVGAEVGVDDAEPAAAAGPASSSGPCRSCRCAVLALASSGDGKLPSPPPSPALPHASKIRLDRILTNIQS